MIDDDDYLDEQVEQVEQGDDEHEPDYCARCRYASRCMGWCSVPPELF